MNELLAAISARLPETSGWTAFIVILGYMGWKFSTDKFVTGKRFEAEVAEKQEWKKLALDGKDTALLQAHTQIEQLATAKLTNHLVRSVTQEVTDEVLPS